MSRNVLRYRDGRAVFVKDNETEEAIAEGRQARRESHPIAMREKAWEEIERRREREQKPPTHAHDEACKHYDARFADLIADPVLRVRSHQGYQAISRRVAATGGQVDWDSELTKLGNGIRRAVGRMSQEEIERAEALAEAAGGRKVIKD